MNKDWIVIKGARENNLKHIDVNVPRDKFVIMTGVSGSGKTSLAFDTIYAEGQRRYVESLSAYARQFLGNSEKPEVDSIEGLSPAISIDQKTTSNNPRSTVGTVTEIYDYLRLLYARIGVPYCPTHHEPITSQTVKQMIDRIMELPDRTRMVILAPIVKGKKGTHKDLLATLTREGYVRVRIDGEVRILEEVEALEKNKKHDIDVVVDRIVKSDDRSRLHDSLESALKLSDGLAIVAFQSWNRSCFPSMRRLVPARNVKGWALRRRSISTISSRIVRRASHRAGSSIIRISSTPRIWNGSGLRRCWRTIMFRWIRRSSRSIRMRWRCCCMAQMSRSPTPFIRAAAM